MKYIVFVAVAAFIAMAQANAKSVVSTVDRGMIADALQSKLTYLKDQMYVLMDKASEKLKEEVAGMQIEVEGLIDQLKDKTKEMTNELYESAQSILIKTGELEDEIYAQATKLAGR